MASAIIARLVCCVTGLSLVDSTGENMAVRIVPSNVEVL